jgi:hypothetical protein
MYAARSLGCSIFAGTMGIGSSETVLSAAATSAAGLSACSAVQAADNMLHNINIALLSFILII